MKETPNLKDAYKSLVKVASDLRDPNGGCPWDLKQDHASMIKHMVEETYEAIDSILALDSFTKKNLKTKIDSNNTYVQDFKEELGDMLFQVVFQSQLASEKDWFSLDDVMQGVAEKLIRRHPHVYGCSDENITEDKVLQNWEAIKREEKKKKGLEKPQGMLSTIPKSMPALLKAFRLVQKVERVSFPTQEWLEKQNVYAKAQTIFSKLQNILEEIATVENITKENFLAYGLFYLVYLSQKKGIDPEKALQNLNTDFIDDFSEWEISID